ncbi:hypothetical protein GCM10010441_04820 [Kitasatospora paracochleata]|uniref:Uncharacterized protein n=1 Tax=Kitasatospora paracochleata TaxID=58354 RepID=A0ABT1JAX3_9ACTN|nr:hypothetical protein [Kitasatospora paracochleata]MCP2313811.1 hypothetical protein [Kitasatospora paracochleata]
MATHQPQRGPRVRRLADRLTARYRTPIEPQYDQGRRSWTLRWYDGPTVGTVRTALERSGPDAAQVLARRDLTTRALVLAALRETRAGAMHRSVGSWGQRYHLEQVLADQAYPDRPNSPREAAMLERLLQAATADSGRRPVPDENRAFDLIARDGIAWLLPSEHLAGPGDHESLALQPLEYLTARYATGVHRTAWETALVTMPVRTAVAAAQADPAPTPEAARAALGLLPTLRAQLAGEIDRAQEQLSRAIPS